MNLEHILKRRGVTDESQPTLPRIIATAVLSQRAVARRLCLSWQQVDDAERSAIAKLRLEIERRASLAGVSVVEWMWAE